MRLRRLVWFGALCLLFAGCGGSGGGSSAGAGTVATPHLAETEVVGAARSGDGDLQLAWAKALRVATAQDVSEFEAEAGGGEQRPHDWYYVQACSFGGVAESFWSNPVAHRVVGANGGGS